MDFQRHSQRRRRVAIDQSQRTHSSDDVETSALIDESGTGAKRPYGPGARRSRQPKTTDLIPKRGWTLAAILAGLALMVALLNLLHAQAPHWMDAIGDRGVQALSLDSSDGIGAWYANFLLLLTCCASLQIFLLRQHRRDDYRGSYRLWLWMAILFLLASAVCVSGIHQLIKHAVGYAANAYGGNGFPWLMAAKLVGLTLLVARGMFEVKHSLAAFIALIVVLTGYAGATLVEVPQIQSRLDGVMQSAQGNFVIVASSALLVAVLMYARFVYMHANGLIVIDPPQSRDNDVDQSSEECATVEKQPLPATAQVSSKSQQRQKQPKSKAKATPAATSKSATNKRSKHRRRRTEDDSIQPAEPKSESVSSVGATADGHDDDSTGVSKSERRRLRKLKRRQNRAAA